MIGDEIKCVMNGEFFQVFDDDEGFVLSVEDKLFVMVILKIKLCNKLDGGMEFELIV